MRKGYTVITLLFLFFLIGLWFYQSVSPTSKISLPSSKSNVLGVNISSAPAILEKCHENNGLPDSKCTPGVIDPRVNQNNIQSTICVSGYTKTVRPPVSYTQDLKKQQIISYGYVDKKLQDYEEDHLISLELGGSPTDPKNLWSEPGNSPNPKDSTENMCHQKVCSGEITLEKAQQEIASDWKTACQ